MRPDHRLVKLYQRVILEQDDHAPSKVEKAFMAFLKNLPDQDFLAIASLDAEQMKQLLFACVKKIDKTRAKEIEQKTAAMQGNPEEEISDEDHEAATGEIKVK